MSRACSARNVPARAAASSLVDPGHPDRPHRSAPSGGSGALLPGLDLDLETRRLSALPDGLTLQAVQHPDLVGPDGLRAVLRRHLDTLATA